MVSFIEELAKEESMHICSLVMQQHMLLKVSVGPVDCFYEQIITRGFSLSPWIWICVIFICREAWNGKFTGSIHTFKALQIEIQNVILEITENELQCEVCWRIPLLSIVVWSSYSGFIDNFWVWTKPLKRLSSSNDGIFLFEQTNKGINLCAFLVCQKEITGLNNIQISKYPKMWVFRSSV